MSTQTSVTSRLRKAVNRLGIRPFAIPSKWSSIPLDHPMIERAKTLIPEEYHIHTWVAGSAATRFGQHHDVDVWVCNVPHTVDITHVIPQGLRPVRQTETLDDDEYIHLCYKAINDDGLQIMVGQDTIHTMLSHFDISCHCGAKNIVTGEEIRGENYSESVKIVNWQVADKTVARYLRFVERYGDWSGRYDSKTSSCVASVFGLFTAQDLQDRCAYLAMDRGL